MKDYTKSRGWRNNNPLNIRRGASWSGLVAEENRTDSLFCQFITMAFGYRAAYKVMKSYYRYFTQQGKRCTVEAIITRWAPPSENRTADYVATVCLLIECRPTDIIEPGTLLGDRHIAWLMAAMTCVECGCKPENVNYSSLTTGIILAGGRSITPEDARL